MRRAGDDELRAAFEAAFGPVQGRKLLLAEAPGRTEIAGNHTDHQGGHTIAAAVDRYCRGLFSPNDEGIARVMSPGHDPVEVDLGSLAPRPDERDSASALGIAAVLAASGLTPAGFDAVVINAVPTGSGLSSSASFELCVASAAQLMWADEGRSVLGPSGLARACAEAERTWYGKPCGLMDQLASSLGGVRFMDFSDPDRPHTEELDSPDLLDLDICLVSLGASHEDLTQAYADIPAEMRAVAASLGAERLADTDEEAVLSHAAELRGELGDRAVLRALHFFREERLVQARARALVTGDARAFVEATRASGASSAMLLQNVSAPGGVSADQPAMAAIALADEVLGEHGAARIHGGGFGGTVQVVCEGSKSEELARAMDAVFGEGSCQRYELVSEGACAAWLA